MSCNPTVFRPLTIVALFFLGSVLAGEDFSGMTANPSQITESINESNDNRNGKSGKALACLPKDVRPDEVVIHGRNGKPDLRVRQILEDLKARCRKGKLIDSKGREIRFFRPSCWGHPPPNYQELRRKENAELADLQKRFTVVVFSCSPTIN